MKLRLVLVLAITALVAPLAAEVSIQQPAVGASFEAASVKPNKSGDRRVSLLFQPGGRFVATGVTVRMLVTAAYGTPQPLPEFQLLGDPAWIGTDRFDVIAKADGDPPPGPNGPPPIMFEMLRTMLADRFKLLVHDEMRELPIYDLVLARASGTLGPRVTPVAVDCAALMRAGRGAPPPLPSSGRVPCGIRMSPGNMVGGAMTMAQMTTVLSRLVNRPVVDRTGLTGTFDVDLTWTPDQIPQAPPDLPPGAPPLPAIDPNGPSLFTAVQEQLGLKLESTRGQVHVVVIDRVEQPSED